MFRYPVKLFLSAVAALLLSGAGYLFTTRCLIRSTLISKSASSPKGPSLIVVMGKPQRLRQRADANLPQWNETPSGLKAELSISPPAAAAPTPVNVTGILGSRLSDSLPATDIKAPVLPPPPAPKQPRIVIIGPAPPIAILPKASLKRPDIPAPDIRASLTPPALPALRPDTRPAEVPLPVDFPPEVEIASP